MIPNLSQKNLKPWLIFFSFILLVGIIIYFGLFWWTNYHAKSTEVYCTQETKQCPDGSYVGRTGPNCEFAPCPGVSNETGNELWATSKDEVTGIEFQYPRELTTKYIFTQEWPPKIAVATGTYSCPETDPTASQPERISEVTLDGQKYCVAAVTEGAAGTAYTTYVYLGEKENNLLTVTFTLAYPNCGNYEDPVKKECEQERESFDLNGVVDKIFKSIKL